MKVIPVLAAVLLLGGVEARAGGASNVTITKIGAEPQGNFFFYLSSNISGSPACVVDPATYGNIFVVDGTTPGGKVVISMVQVAYALGKTVTMSGSNLCDVHAGVETIAEIHTTN